MHDAQGRSVPVHPNPELCRIEENCYALIPIAPLARNTTYTVRARGIVESYEDGSLAPFDRSWTFTTAP